MVAGFMATQHSRNINATNHILAQVAEVRTVAKPLEPVSILAGTFQVLNPMDLRVHGWGNIYGDLLDAARSSGEYDVGNVGKAATRFMCPAAGHCEGYGCTIFGLHGLIGTPAKKL